MSEQLTSSKDLKRVLTFKDLVLAGVGSIVGSGIMSLTGWAIADTGRSVPIAIFLGAIFMLCMRLPLIFINSVARFRGGVYSMVGTMLGKKWAGAYSLICFLTSITCALYCLSFADYAMPFLPFLPRKVIAIGIVTILIVVNYFGVNVFAKVQNLTVFVLAIALTLFTIVGFTHLDGNYFDPQSWMTGGIPGLLKASILMSFTCDGAQYLSSFSPEAKDPARDIPRAMLVSTIGVAIFYGLMSIVAAGVLPVADVAGQPLSTVADVIFSRPLYYFFMIGGAWMALLTTLNADIATFAIPMIQSCNDGWFPKSWAKLHPKYRTPLFWLGYYWVCCTLPILFNLDVNTIADVNIGIGAVTKFMVLLCFFRLPKVLPDPWKKSKFHLNTPAFIILGLLSMATILYSGATSFLDLPPILLTLNILVVIASFIYGAVRANSSKIHMEVSYELTDSEEYASGLEN